MPPIFGAITLNGSNQYARAPHAAKFDFPSSNFQVSLWFRSSSSGALINKFTSPNGYRLDLLSNGQVQATVNNTTIQSDAQTYADNTWHYASLAADRVNQRLHLFVDLTFKSTFLTTGTASNSAPLLLGVNPGAAYGFFNGSLAEVRIQKDLRRAPDGTILEPITVLPSSQEDDNPNTVSLYHFNEGRDGVLLDTSAAIVTKSDTPSHVNASIFNADASIWSTQGPLRASPITVANEAILYATDTDAKIAAFANDKGIYRFRNFYEHSIAQSAVTALFEANMVSDFVPTLGVVPVGFATSRVEQSIEIEDNANFQEEAVSISVLGGVKARVGELDTIEQLQYLVTKALLAREEVTNGDMGFQQIARIQLQEATFDAGLFTTNEGLLQSEAKPIFIQPIVVFVQRDLRVSE